MALGKSGLQMSLQPSQRRFDELEGWLLKEELKTGDGFYCNLHLLKESFVREEMAVAILNGETVGFLTWHQSSDFGVYINISEVRPDLQGRGLGRKLVTYMFQYFRKMGFCVVDLECTPDRSEGFWKRMDFHEFPESSRGWKFQVSGHKRLYKTLENTLESGTSTSPGDEVFELWNDDAHLMRDAAPSWIWKLEFKEGTRELVKPIIHPAAPEWRARWRQGVEVFKDGPVKRLLPWKNTTGSFIVVNGMG